MAKTMATTFPLFPLLPFELRDQIWHDALPYQSSNEPAGKRLPALYFYRGRGCWVPRELTESDPGYRAGRNELGFCFRTDLLGHADNQFDNQFDVPLVFVNREARRVAMTWLHSEGIQIRPHADSKTYLFVRPFTSHLDASYIPPDKWEDFCLEPTDRLLEPDLHGQSVDLHSDLVKMAVPESLLHEEVISWLPEMEKWFQHLRLLFVVVGPHEPDGRVTGPWRWEIEGGEDDASYFSWNKDNKEFDFHEGNQVFRNKTLYKMAEANSGLREELIKCRLSRFEVRPVVAVKR